MRRSPVRNLTVFVALAVLLGGAAVAQTSLEQPPLDERSAKRLDRLETVVKELRAIIFQGRETGQPVVVQPADTQSQIESLQDKISDLDHTLTRLNGENDVIRHDLDEARREMLDLHTANDSLKAQVAAFGQQIQVLTAPPPAPTAPAAAAAPPPTPGAAFAQARATLQSGDAASATAALQIFVEQYGDTPHGPEARYLLGRLLLDQRAFADAATAEIGAIRDWPQTSWAPAAVLDLARALVGMKKDEDACQTLEQLAKHYPRASGQIATGVADLRGQAHCG